MDEPIKRIQMLINKEWKDLERVPPDDYEREMRKPNPKLRMLEYRAEEFSMPHYSSENREYIAKHQLDSVLCGVQAATEDAEKT